MKGMLSVTLVGTVCQDPKVGKAGDADVVNMRLACNVRKDKTEFIDVACWRGLAKVAGEYCKKGTHVAVSGSMVSREWEKNGEKHRDWEVTANDVVLLPSGGPQAEKQAAPGNAPF